MRNQNNFVSEKEEIFIYFYMESVDAELADDLHDYLYEHVVKARNANETLYVGHVESDWSHDVIRYGIELKDATRANVDEIKRLVTVFTNQWVANMGGADSVN